MKEEKKVEEVEVEVVETETTETKVEEKKKGVFWHLNAFRKKHGKTVALVVLSAAAGALAGAALTKDSEDEDEESLSFNSNVERLGVDIETSDTTNSEDISEE